MFTIILGFATSFILVLLSIPALIKIAYLKRLVDEPGDRKLHNRRIPSIGGILLFAGTLFSYFLWHPFNDITEYGHLIRAINDFKYIGASMLILFFIGIKDDIIGTAPVKKLVGHLIVAFILVLMADMRITSLHGLLGVYEIPFWASIFLSVFVYTVIVNAVNLIDGVDGLAAGIGLIVCLTYGIWFYLAGGIENACLAFALGGSLLGFLFFNFSPAKIFMGDSGSLVIGLIISVLSIKLIEFDHSEMEGVLGKVSTPVYTMAALAYPLIDTLRVFVYRAVKGASPFSADRNHIHHRLIDIGMSQAVTVFTLYFYTIAVVVSTVYIFQEPTYQLLGSVGIALALIQIPFFIPKRKNRNKRGQ